MSCLIWGTTQIILIYYLTWQREAANRQVIIIIPNFIFCIILFSYAYTNQKDNNWLLYKTYSSTNSYFKTKYVPHWLMLMLLKVN